MRVGKMDKAKEYWECKRKRRVYQKEKTYLEFDIVGECTRI
jgi:hypothetical protein